MEKPTTSKSKSTKEIENCLAYYEIRIKRSLRDPKFVLEIAGFVVLAIYAGFTIAMYFANKTAADAATRAAAAAEDSIVQTREGSHLDERAWLGVEAIGGTPEIDKPLIVEIVFKNSGRTP